MSKATASIYYYDTALVETAINDEDSFPTFLAAPLPSDALGGNLTGINNVGQIVGSFSVTSTRQAGYFATNGFEIVLNPDFASSLSASAINDSGEVVGTYFDDSQSNSPHGFLYNNGFYGTFDDPLGVLGTEVTGINDSLAIVGNYWDANNVVHGFLYYGGVYQTIDDPLGTTEVFGINAEGEIVGDVWDASGVAHGFLYYNGIFTKIDDAKATSGTYLTGINDYGVVVGYYDAGGVVNGFVATTAPPQFALFGARDPRGVYGLWATDGTAEGTFDLTRPPLNAHPPTGLTFLRDITVLGQKALFSGQTNNGDFNLWVTDGTIGGTHQLDVADAASNGLNPLMMVEFNGEVLFSGNGVDGANLWVSDGTTSETHEILAPSQGRRELLPSSLTVFDGKVIFSGVDAFGLQSLWVTNGTSAGTHEIPVNGAGKYGLLPYQFTVYGDEVLFGGYGQDNKGDLWVTDGTTAGTHEVVVNGAGPSGIDVQSIALAGGRIFFAGTDTTGVEGLWTTDGTTDVTYEITNNGGGNFNPYGFTQVNSVTAFAGRASDGTVGLWVTDGTASGTHELDVAGVSSLLGLDPTNISLVKGKLLFDGFNAANVSGLWVSDGTAAGTYELRGIPNADPTDFFPYDITPFNAPSPAPAPTFESSDPSWKIVASADFTGDGVTDYAWRNAAGETQIWNADVAGGYAVNNFGAVNGWQVKGAGDVTGDKVADLLWTNANDDEIAWYWNGTGYSSLDMGVVSNAPPLGGGRIPPVFSSTADPTWKIEASADFTGDGLTDYVWRNASGDTQIWNGEASGSYDVNDFGPVSEAWQVAGVRDASGDGKPDLIWADSSQREIAWVWNGSGYTSLTLAATQSG